MCKPYYTLINCTNVLFSFTSSRSESGFKSALSFFLPTGLYVSRYDPSEQRVCHVLLSVKRRISTCNFLKSKEKGLSCLRLRLTIAAFEKTGGGESRRQSPAPLPFCCMSVIVIGLNSGETYGHQAK